MNNPDPNLASLLVQVVLAVIMLAVAFELTISDIKQLPKMWRKLLLGYLMQVTFLPVFIFSMLLIINPSMNLVLAFLLLASCPGGNLSQLFVVRSKGNIGLSTGLTFFSTLFSPITVPAIFFLATHGNSEWSETYKTLEIPWGNIFKTLVTSLFIPLMIGIWMRSKTFPRWIKVREWIQQSVPWLLFALLSGASWSFRKSILEIDISMILMVAGISVSCFILTFLINRLISQDYVTSVTIAWEVSIQNSGLGMVLGLVYFSNVPEVSLVCALWGVWQMAMGYIVSGFMNKIFSRNEVVCQTLNAG